MFCTVVCRIDLKRRDIEQRHCVNLQALLIKLSSIQTGCGSCSKAFLEITGIVKGCHEFIIASRSARKNRQMFKSLKVSLCPVATLKAANAVPSLRSELELAIANQRCVESTLAL